MSPDDKRHGTPRGYRVHREYDEDACPPCADAWYLYNKRATLLRIGGQPLRVSSRGTQRRVRALMALGYGLPTIAGHLGIATGNLSYKMQQPYVARTTHDAVAALFDRLSMQPPPTGWVAERTRNIARKRGWPAPLAWDDIDNDDEPPTALYDDVPDDVDPVVVMRLLEGSRITATKAEREEALSRWVAGGGTKTEFCNLHGWAPGRYGQSALRLVEEVAS